MLLIRSVFSLLINDITIVVRISLCVDLDCLSRYVFVLYLVRQHDILNYNFEYIYYFSILIGGEEKSERNSFHRGAPN